MSHRIAFMLILLLMWAGIAPAHPDELTSKTLAMLEAALASGDLRVGRGDKAIDTLLSRDPVRRATAQRVWLEHLDDPRLSDLSKAIIISRIVGRDGNSPDMPEDVRDALKSRVLTIIRTRIPRSPSDPLLSDAIWSLPSISLTPEEYDELLSRTLTIDPPINERFKHCGTGRSDFGGMLLTALAKIGGLDSYPRLKAHWNNHSIRGHDVYRWRFPIATRSPEAYRDLLAHCRSKAPTGGATSNALNFLAGVLIRDDQDFTPAERDEALALIRSALHSRSGYFTDSDRAALVRVLAGALKEADDSIGTAYVDMLEETRAFWSAPDIASSFVNIDGSIQSWRARRAASAPGASGS